MTGQGNDNITPAIQEYKPSSGNMRAVDLRWRIMNNLDTWSLCDPLPRPGDKVPSESLLVNVNAALHAISTWTHDRLDCLPLDYCIHDARAHRYPSKVWFNKKLQKFQHMP